jgi:hypothetical protein
VRETKASWQVSARLRAIRSLLLAKVVEEKLRNLQRAVKANFDPNQPRVPRGNPDGGQWTGTGGGGERTRIAQMPRGSRRIGSDAEGTPDQEARLAAEEVQAQEAIRRVREIDPTWSPQESLTDPNSIEGQIATARGRRQEAEDRLIELAREPVDSLIEAYHQQQEQDVDLFGVPVWSRKRNTVAVCKMADKVFLGVNSTAQKYSFRDLQDAERLRTTLIGKHPHVMSTDNIGQFPNDALFHSEMTCLMRAARANGGTLKGQTVEMTVDRDMCESCKRILPLIGLELGNPTVKFADPRGSIRVMRDGSWAEIESP